MIQFWQNNQKLVLDLLPSENKLTKDGAWSFIKKSLNAKVVVNYINHEF